MSTEASTSSTESVYDFVKLVLGKTRLLLPDTELLSIESITDVRQSHKNNGIHSCITINSADIPVYVFDEDLRLISAMDNQYQVCVCLDNGQDRIGILCDDAGKVTLDDIKLHALPACMHGDETVIMTVAVNNNNLYCVSNTANLIQLIKNSSFD